MGNKETTINDLTLDYGQWTDILDCIGAALGLSLNNEQVLSMPVVNKEQTEILREYYTWISEALENTDWQ